MKTQAEKADLFQKLHLREGAFFIPNPWDIGSARMLAGLGFEALATTSSGFAFTLGRLDGQVTLDEKLAHCRALASATDVPISADLENGFGHTPEAVTTTIKRAAETGIVGGSIEDYANDEGMNIYDFTLAVERVEAAVEAARSLAFPFTVTARAENLIRGVVDMEDTIRRLQAFAAAGADVLYAPGLRTIEQIKMVTAAVDKPVNVLGALAPGISLADMAAAGVKRVSIGGAMTRVSFAKAIEAGLGMMTDGLYDWSTNARAAANLAQLLDKGSG